MIPLWMLLQKLKVWRYRRVINLADFPQCQLLVSLLLRSRYYSVVSHYCAFPDVVQQLCDKLGYTMEQAQHVVILNVVYIDDRNVDYLVDNNLIALVAE